MLLAPRYIVSEAAVRPARPVRPAAVQAQRASSLSTLSPARPSQSMPVTGLDLATDSTYEVEFVLKNAGGSALNPNVFMNGDAVAANYYSQIDYGNAGTPAAARTNSASWGGVPASGSVIIHGKLKHDADGLIRFIYQVAYGTTTGLLHLDGNIVRQQRRI